MILNIVKNIIMNIFKDIRINIPKNIIINVFKKYNNKQKNIINILKI